MSILILTSKTDHHLYFINQLKKNGIKNCLKAIYRINTYNTDFFNLKRIEID